MALIDTLQEKFGKEFHPAMLLAEVIQNDSEDTKLRVDCAKSLMPYIEASKKAIEVHANINQNVGLLRVNLFQPDEDKLIDDNSPNLLDL